VADIQTIGVLGAGQMGGGIAQVAAGKDIRVLLADQSRKHADDGKARIAKGLGKLVEKGKITAEARDALLSNIETVDSIDAFGAVDFAIEAATENIELKKQLMRNLDAAVKPGSIVATNTSSISITLLGAQTKRPEQVVGMHFMNPVPVMELVEIIRGLPTSDETYDATLAFAQRLGKVTVTSKDCAGFIVNRVLIPLINEACFALQEGLGTPQDIDLGCKKGLNHPMGPLELADLIGLDTCLAIAEVLQRELGDDKYRPANILRMHVAAGWLGRKTGRGFYDYRSK
jgi:3-hydroxybutyryl-CoA dehydrogenase